MTGVGRVDGGQHERHPVRPGAPVLVGVEVTSRPWDVGTLVLLKMPPSWVVVAEVRRSVPEPCVSDVVGQLASGLAVALPAAVRQAELVTVGDAGIDTDPAGPSTVLSWNGWLNSTVPAAAALGAGATIPTVTALITSSTAAGASPSAGLAGRRPFFAFPLSTLASSVFQGRRSSLQPPRAPRSGHGVAHRAGRQGR
jgi:hypothetical protein